MSICRVLWFLAFYHALIRMLGIGSLHNHCNCWLFQINILLLLVHNCLLLIFFHRINCYVLFLIHVIYLLYLISFFFFKILKIIYIYIYTFFFFNFLIFLKLFIFYLPFFNFFKIIIKFYLPFFNFFKKPSNTFL
jgi:hypothetical protein